jgi:ribonucleotide monophosphatase NagD (HAD superfamily)
VPLDIDGVLYVDDEPIVGAVDACEPAADHRLQLDR